MSAAFLELETRIDSRLWSDAIAILLEAKCDDLDGTRSNHVTTRLNRRSDRDGVGSGDWAIYLLIYWLYCRPLP